MQRRLFHATLTAIALAALACDSPMQPDRAASAAPAFQRSPTADLHAMNTGASAAGAPGQVVACSNRTEASGSALIGPAGGTLVVGNSRLIIPPGAVTEPTLISGTVPDTTIAIIQFEPTGLQFKKPAGLQLDVSGCNATADDSPAVVYVDDAGNTSERIDAVFSNDWHTVAAPIAHFSGYAFAF